MLLRNSLDSSLIILDIYPQAHGAIIVAFHLKVFRVSLFIFFQRKAWCKDSSMDMIRITCLHNGPKFMIGVNIVWFKDSVTHTRAYHGGKDGRKNE